jgi:hypothetical protein
MHGSATTTSSVRSSRPESVGSEPQILAALKLPGIEAMPSDGRSSCSGKPTCKQEVHFPGPRVEVPIRHSPSAVLQASNREVSGTKQHDGAAIAAGLCSRLHASARESEWEEGGLRFSAKSFALFATMWVPSISPPTMSPS